MAAETVVARAGQKPTKHFLFFLPPKLPRELSLELLLVSSWRQARLARGLVSASVVRSWLVHFDKRLKTFCENLDCMTALKPYNARQKDVESFMKELASK